MFPLANLYCLNNNILNHFSVRIFYKQIHTKKPERKIGGFTLTFVTNFFLTANQIF